MNNTFVCSLKPQGEFPILTMGEKKKTRSGRYHNSRFSGVPKGKYVVALYVESDNFDNLLAQKTPLEEIKEMVLEVLNHPSGRNKKPKYGMLEFLNNESFACFFKKNEYNKNYMVALMLTNDRRNKNFWGFGNSKSAKKFSTRGRKRKK